MGTSVASRGLLDLKREGTDWPMFVKKYVRAYIVHMIILLVLYIYSMKKFGAANV